MVQLEGQPTHGPDVPLVQGSIGGFEDLIELYFVLFGDVQFTSESP